MPAPVRCARCWVPLILLPLIALLLLNHFSTELDDVTRARNLRQPMACQTSHKDRTNETHESRLALLLRLGFPLESDVNFSAYELNAALSNLLPLDRLPPDTRHPACLAPPAPPKEGPPAPSEGGPPGGLQDVSVVIPFYDESWSMLLRAVHSVLGRTDPALLREVLLVDDASERPHLGAPLDAYLALLPPGERRVRVVRCASRQGLVRARLRAARQATGQVLVFLDAHVEVNVGWLEPLLALVREDRTTLVVPRVDAIDPVTLRYSAWDYEVHGALTWTMEYVWKFLPRDVMRDVTLNRTASIPTPTTIGCAMAIDRKFFFDVGAFDEGMLVWGGENLEISLRVWTCGGSVRIAPCSRVGHVFRRWLPYSFPPALGGASVKQRNYQRIADVWLDEHARYYYAAQGERVLPSPSSRRSLEARRRLRARLGCRPFSWYLARVLPDLLPPPPDATHFGQLKNLYTKACLRAQPYASVSSSASSSLSSSATSLNLSSFSSETSASSGFSLNSSSPDGSTEHAAADADDPYISMTLCAWHDVTMTFSLSSTTQITHAATRRCLTARDENYVTLEACDALRRDQRWDFTPVGATHWARHRSASVDKDSYRELDSERTRVGKLAAVTAGGKALCLSQVTVPRSAARQIAGLLPCAGVGEGSDAFQYWYYTYTLDWSVV